jgi:hypothetical protein
MVAIPNWTALFAESRLMLSTRYCLALDLIDDAAKIAE